MSPQDKVMIVQAWTHAPPLLSLDGLSWGERVGVGKAETPQLSLLCHRGRGVEGRAGMRAYLTMQWKGQRAMWIAASLPHPVGWPHVKSDLSFLIVSALARTLESVTSKASPLKHTHTGTHPDSGGEDRPRRRGDFLGKAGAPNLNSSVYPATARYLPASPS